MSICPQTAKCTEALYSIYRSCLSSRWLLRQLSFPSDPTPTGAHLGRIIRRCNVSSWLSKHILSLLLLLLLLLPLLPSSFAFRLLSPIGQTSSLPSTWLLMHGSSAVGLQWQMTTTTTTTTSQFLYDVRAVSSTARSGVFLIRELSKAGGR